ncbi:hypothetical protein K2173_002294 [Erythroxylum novogranatense]|uniref:Uncharacterized protein n=1 Tax=Erythroxylum novogranatense TaxID=1862640 RepID=A0AAV8TAP2_9ROSI|nr:hypothetical protein K2173_002294 [Erythroxylum novogranatense]
MKPLLSASDCRDYPSCRLGEDPEPSSIGTTVRLDDDTLHANHGRYARIAVDMDLTSPLPPTVELDGETLLLTYEGLPQVCYTYGVVGHTPSACAKNSASFSDPPPQVSDAGSGESELSRSVEATREPQEPAPNNGYGPWMIVCNDDKWPA